MNKKYLIATVGLVVFVALFFFIKGEVTETAIPAPIVKASPFPTPSKAIKVALEPISPSKTIKAESIPQSVWKLDASNFEERAGHCFQAEPCELEIDAFALYEIFKKEGKDKAIDLLIAYLRRDLRNPEHAKKYREPLKKLIQDFYPPSEIQFQLAAYYNYLGELEKSLELYLDLEKKHAIDPSLHKAPKLNIANTFYDLGRYNEALPYYEAALKNNLRPEMKGPQQDDIVRFIERRIEEIKAKIKT